MKRFFDIGGVLPVSYERRQDVRMHFGGNAEADSSRFKENGCDVACTTQHRFADRFRAGTAACLIAVCLSLTSYATLEPMSLWTWLDGYGLGAGHDVTFVWQERATGTAEGYVWGCRLAPLDGTAPVDVYFDSAGALLSSAALTSLGLGVKDWDAAEADVPAAIVAFPDARGKDAGVLPFTPIAAPPLHTLDPLDHEVLLEEDAWRDETVSDSLMRYGVNRYLSYPLTLSDGFCNTGALRVERDGGWRWELQARSVDALGVRLCFNVLQLPAGVAAYVYNPDEPTAFFGPIPGGTNVWTPTIAGDGVGIFLSGDNATQLEAVSASVSRLIHVYRSPVLLEKTAGACHLDMACYPEWAEHGLAVGRLGLVTYDAWACTGALLAAPGYGENPPPLLLTANHCISSQALAHTLEVWWLYERAGCGEGEIPDMASLPRSANGAVYLAGSDANYGTDFSLLLLNEPPPATLTYLGYTTRATTVSAPAVCIHHPQGTEKRISFGYLSDTGSPRLGGAPLAPATHFHEVLWLEGSTEGGSSGSPLFLEGEMQVIGQLYGGYASCRNMDEPDYYGRFDVAYPIIAPWLSGENELPPVDAEGEPEREGEDAPPAEGEPMEGEDALWEGEQEDEGEDESDSYIFWGLIRRPTHEPAATLFRYGEILLRLLAPVLGLLLVRYFWIREVG